MSYAGSNFVSQAVQEEIDAEATIRQDADTNLQGLISGLIESKVNLSSSVKQTITNALDIGGNVNIIGGGEFQIDGVPIGGGGGSGDVTLTGVQTLTNKTMSANNNTFVNLAAAISPYSLNTTQVFQLDLKLNDRLFYYKPGIIQMRLPSNYEGPYVDAGLPFQVPLNIVLDRDNIFPPQLDYGKDPNGPDLIIYNAGTYEVSFSVSIEDAGRCRAFFECLTPFGNPTIKIEGNNTYIPAGSFGQMTGYGVFTILENQSLFKLWLQCNGDGRFNPVFDGYNTDEIYATVVIHRLR